MSDKEGGLRESGDLLRLADLFGSFWINDKCAYVQWDKVSTSVFNIRYGFKTLFKFKTFNYLILGLIYIFGLFCICNFERNQCRQYPRQNTLTDLGGSIAEF